MMNRACLVPVAFSLKSRLAITTSRPVFLSAFVQHRTLFAAILRASHSPAVTAIEESLNKAFQPSFLKVFDESNKFYAPPNAGTHFKIVLASQEFEYAPSEQSREHMILGVLEEPLKAQPAVQRIRTVALTPDEHARLVSKYSTPNQWIAMIAEE